MHSIQRSSLLITIGCLLIVPSFAALPLGCSADDPAETIGTSSSSGAGGALSQAGPRPQIGDVQANRWPKHYVTLAKVLKKIQIKDHNPFHCHAPGRMDYEASLAWLFRFDGK